MALVEIVAVLAVRLANRRSAGKMGRSSDESGSERIDSRIISFHIQPAFRQPIFARMGKARSWTERSPSPN
jgi:hypothetical protein